jgi:hypothetical protein
MDVVRISSAAGGSSGSSSSGRVAAAEWLADRRIQTPSLKRGHVEVSLATLDTAAPMNYDDRVDTRFHIDIYAEEWGFFFCHEGRASWIRITDIPFVHGRDDFTLLAQTPALPDIGALLRTLEALHKVGFRRKLALVRTNVPASEGEIRTWIERL